MGTWKLAWRNVWRNRRRSLVTMAAMTLSLTILIQYSGLIAGYIRGMERNVVDIEVGDVQIHAAGYLELPSKYTYIDDPEGLLSLLDEAGYRASARLMAGGLAGSEDSSAGVLLRGLNVARDREVSHINRAIAEGQWLDPAHPQGVVIGRRLARTLAAGVGDELVVFTQAMDGGMSDNLFEIRGVLQSVGEGTDRGAIFMTEDSFRELLVFPSGAHQLIVRRPTEQELPEMVERIEALAASLSEPASAGVEAAERSAAGAALDVRSWKELLPTIAQMLETSGGMMIIIIVVIYVVVGILIMNAMLMAVFERIREFGVLKALGSGPERVFLLIVCESSIQIGLAVVCGTLLAIPGIWYLSTRGLYVGSLSGMTIGGIAMDANWMGFYTPASVMTPILLLVFMALVAVIYPAFKAAWISPVEAIRHQ